MLKKKSRRKRRPRSRNKWLYIVVVAIVIVVVGYMGYMLMYKNNGQQRIEVKINSARYTFNIGVGNSLTYRWEQWLVYPNGTRIPFGKVSNGTYTYTILNVSTQKVFRTEDIPVWFIVKVVNNGVEMKGTSKVYFTSIALPIQLLGKPVLNLTPERTTINIHGINYDVWEYKGRMEPKSPECYVLEDKYYYSVDTGVLVREEVKCFTPPLSGYPNGTYILYYKELVTASGT